MRFLRLRGRTTDADWGRGRPAGRPELQFGRSCLTYCHLGNCRRSEEEEEADIHTHTLTRVTAEKRRGEREREADPEVRAFLLPFTTVRVFIATLTD